MKTSEDATSRGNDESGSLSMDAQEWKWYLEDHGYASVEDHGDETGTSSATVPIIEEEKRRTISCLPNDAAVYKTSLFAKDLTNDDTRRTLLNGLALLHRCVTYDMSTLHEYMKQNSSRCRAIKVKLDFFQSRHEQCRKDWKAVQDEYKVPSNIVETIETKQVDKVSQSIRNWVETALRPNSVDHVNKMFDQNVAGDLGQIVSFYHYYVENINSKGLQSQKLPILSSFIDSGSNVVSDIEMYHNLLKELVFLESFLNGRLLDATMAAKKKISFLLVQQMSRSEDSAAIKAHVSKVKSIQAKLRETEDLECWKWWDVETSQQDLIIQHLVSTRNKLLQAQAKVNVVEEKELAPIQNKAQALENDRQWCQDRITVLREELERAIQDVLQSNNNYNATRLIRIKT